MKTEHTVRELREIAGDMVIDMALQIFENAKDDYCVQYISGGGIVFGGINRLFWTPMQGFTLDFDYCTEDFIRHYAKLRRSEP